MKTFSRQIQILAVSWLTVVIFLQSLLEMGAEFNVAPRKIDLRTARDFNVLAL